MLHVPASLVCSIVSSLLCATIVAATLVIFVALLWLLWLLVLFVLAIQVGALVAARRGWWFRSLCAFGVDVWIAVGRGC